MGMVMCATSSEDGTVRVLQPSEGATAGQVLRWRNSGDYTADEKINIGKKNSFWKKDIVEKLRTNAQGEMAFDGECFVIGNENNNTQEKPNADTRRKVMSP